MYFTSACFSSGCCCGSEGMVAPTEQNISVTKSEAKDPKSPESSQNSYPCESCAPVLRDIFLLVDQHRIQKRPTLLRCGACAKPFYFSAQCNKHQEEHTTKNSFLGSVDRVSHAKSSNFNASWKPCTSSQGGKCFVISLGHIEQLAAHTTHRANKISKSEMTFQSTKYYYIPRECKKAIGCNDILVEDQRFLTGRQCFVCCECGKSFTNSSSFCVHQRVHTG